jgi:hypothetical protein
MRRTLSYRKFLSAFRTCCVNISPCIPKVWRVLYLKMNIFQAHMWCNKCLPLSKCCVIKRKVCLADLAHSAIFYFILLQSGRGKFSSPFFVTPTSIRVQVCCKTASLYALRNMHCCELLLVLYVPDPTYQSTVMWKRIWATQLGTGILLWTKADFSGFSVFHFRKK